MTLEGLYPTKPIIQKNNWNKWLETSDNNLIEFVNKIKNSYKFFRKIGLKVIEVIEPPTTDRLLWIHAYPVDYTFFKYPELYKDKKNIIPHIIINYKLNDYLELETDYFQRCIEARIMNMSIMIKDKLDKYMNINFNKQFKLVELYDNDYILNFCMKDPDVKLKSK